MDMERSKKRPSRDESSSQTDDNKKPHRSSSPSPSPSGKRPTFTSYTEIPNLRPKIKLLCEIVSTTPSPGIETALDQAGVIITAEDVEEVLKLSYSTPGSTVKFFRWAGRQLNDNHSPYAWNLVIDLLGKNLLFDAMWDAIKSMKREGLLSLATFASIFSSYVVANRVDEAIMTFEVMDQYGCPKDIVALNSLLSAICRQGKTSKAKEFLQGVMGIIRPDVDTYAILLEGWENEGDALNSNKTFADMVNLFGWNPAYVPSYDAFLNTLLKGHDGLYEAMKFYEVLKERRCFPGMKFFREVMNKLVKSHKTREVWSIWEGMIRAGYRPDTQLYNTMISFQCNISEYDDALRLVDEMIIYGAFPDSQTYNILLQFLLKSRKLVEVSSMFRELVKNECVPSQDNCTTAVKVYIDVGDPDMAIKIWKCMLDNEMPALEDTGNLLILGLRDLSRLPEARKYAEDMIERGIKVSSKTLSSLKQSFTQMGKQYIYDELLRKWKSKSHLS